MKEKSVYSVKEQIDKGVITDINYCMVRGCKGKQTTVFQRATIAEEAVPEAIC